MAYKKFFLSLILFPVLLKPAFADRLDYKINLNPIKLVKNAGSFLSQERPAWQTLSIILGPIGLLIAYKVYCDNEMDKRAAVISNAIAYHATKNLKSYNAPQIAKTCYRLWLPFMKDPTVARAVKLFEEGKMQEMGFVNQVSGHYTLNDYFKLFWIPGWFSKN